MKKIMLNISAALIVLGVLGIPVATYAAPTDLDPLCLELMDLPHQFAGDVAGNVKRHIDEMDEKQLRNAVFNLTLITMMPTGSIEPQQERRRPCSLRLESYDYRTITCNELLPQIRQLPPDERIIALHRYLRGYCDLTQYHFHSVELSHDEIIARKDQGNGGNPVVSLAYLAGVNTAAKCIGLNFDWELNGSLLPTILEEEEGDGSGDEG